MNGIDLCSGVPLFVSAKFRDQVLSEATAFLWEVRGRFFLITNWHVATGRNHETGRCLASHGGVPNQLIVAFPKNERSDPPIEVVVSTVDEDGNPLWIEHPTYGATVDVVALPIVPPEMSESHYFPLSAIPTMPLKQRVGMPVFILGFPFGRRGAGMPVWKQGSFASEPFLAPVHERFLIVDTASRPGMSGSPVIQRVHGEVELEDGTYGRVTRGDGACRFVGVYSGRFHTDNPQDAQLGRVWPRQLVVEIVEAAYAQTRFQG